MAALKIHSPASRKPLRLAQLLVAVAFGVVSVLMPARRAMADDPQFDSFLQSLWPAAAARGVSRATFDSAVAGLTPDMTLPALNERQRDFDQPLSAYLAQAVNKDRIARGRAALATYRAELGKIEARYGVPREILLALWGMETDFGRDLGNRPVLRSLATLAYVKPRGGAFAAEFVAALVMLQKGLATPRTLVGSWAGALGQPQFLPSVALRYDVSADGGRAPDIWNSIPDALASMANFMRASGWRPGLAWGAEVRLPKDFTYASLKGDFAAFRRAGFRAVGGDALPSAGTATLYLPGGAGGPAFLLSDNYWVIKQYNNSDAYALAVAGLAERIGEGAVWPETAWPTGQPMLDVGQRTTLQTDLAHLGFYHDTIDGKIGPSTRDALHDFAIATGYAPADGYASAEILGRVEQAARDH